MSRRRKPRPSRAPAVLALLLLGGLGGAGFYAWRYHPEWLKFPSPPGKQARAASPRPAAPRAVPEPLQARTVTAKLHLVRVVDGEARLVPVTRQLPAKAPARAALEELLSAQTSEESRPPLPPGVKLRGVSIHGGTVRADFSRELVANFHGGASDEKAAVYAIVETLTSLPGVKRVQILVEGKKVDSLGGHLDLSEPLSSASGQTVQP